MPALQAASVDVQFTSLNRKLTSYTPTTSPLLQKPASISIGTRHVGKFDIYGVVQTRT